MNVGNVVPGHLGAQAPVPQGQPGPSVAQAACPQVDTALLTIDEWMSHLNLTQPGVHPALELDLEVGKKAVCLLCSERVAVMTEYNVSRHHATTNAAMAGYGSTMAELDRKLVKQQNVFVKTKVAQKAATHASLVVAYNIAKHSKSFSDELPTGHDDCNMSHVSCTIQQAIGGRQNSVSGPSSPPATHKHHVQNADRANDVRETHPTQQPTSVNCSVPGAMNAGQPHYETRSRRATTADATQQQLPVSWTKAVSRKPL
ncbi:hypothetical protein C0Q70_14559 [Pomacea canaliculata]|uniref:SPIN-DOC-like zinc-finger domain-containing protein n=1 Tax=Pomacea canaliculata TaxID=400727 RepID=A0A2T7NSD3_POMCA|nr:hypothetical protein C0Q70_14559 [Pomacea canaliculata]